MDLVNEKSSYVIGIDLGTSTTIGSIFTKGKSKNIKVEGNDYLPSIVSFLNNGDILVGQAAKGRTMLDPTNTVSSIKSHMGEESYKVKAFEKEYLPEEISAEILKKMKDAAMQQEDLNLNGNLVYAVICVPANFPDNAKQATIKAAELAGLEVLYLLEEPVAAAIMYGFNAAKDQNILVYDLGGGTFDACILNAKTNSEGKANYKILSKEGINKLGGDDFDYKIMEIINEKFIEENNIDLLNLEKDQGISKKKLKEASQKLKEVAEKSKIELSEMDSTNIMVPNIIQNEAGELLNIDICLTRNQFNENIEPLIRETEEVVLKAIGNAKLTIEDMDKIILVGGSTLVPRIKEKIKEIFGIEPYSNFNPRTIVSEGAAIFGATLSVPEDAVDNGEKDIEAEIEINQIVTHNLGIMTSGMKFSKLIEKGMQIPTGENITEEKEYTTQYDNQKEIKLYIYQSYEEIEFVNEKYDDGKEKCICIGEFILKGIPEAKQGKEKIVVKFEVNDQNIVNVIATCLSTNNESKAELNIQRR